MNILNRIISIFLFLILLIVAAVAAAFPIQALTILQNAIGVAIGYLQLLEQNRFWVWLALRAGLLVLAVFIFGPLLWGELRPSRAKTVKVHTEGGSQAEVTSDSVARRLAWQIDQLADIISVTPHVIPRGRSVDVILDLQTAPEVDVPMKTDEVVNCACEVIVDRMGLQPGKIQVRISHTPYSDEA